VGAVTPGIHLRWLPGARIEFPYRERTMGVARSGGNRMTLDDFGVVRLEGAICQASHVPPHRGGGVGACSSMTL
jgi:hypothetical protein